MSMEDTGMGGSAEFVKGQTQDNISSRQQHDTSDSAFGSGSANESAISEQKKIEDYKERVLEACEFGRLVDVRELAAGKKNQLKKKIPLKNCRAKNPHRDTPLHVAAYFGHKNIVEYMMVEEEFDVEIKNNYKNTPLHRAARQGRLEVVKYLVEEKKSDPMAVCVWGRTPLHNACKTGQLEVVKYLMTNSRVVTSAKDSVRQQTPLQLAAEYGTVEVVQYMMENGVDRDESGPYTLLHLAAFGGKLDIVQYLVEKRICNPMIRDKDERTPLHSACVKGQLQIVKFLVDECEADVSSYDNRYKESPLDMASKHGEMKVLKYLVEEKNCTVEHGKENEDTPLHHAAWGGALDAMKYFIEGRKCNPSCKGRKNRTSLHSACYSGKSDVVDYLVDQHRVDVSCKDHDGATPLHLAAKGGHLQLVKRLVRKYRCDHTITNNTGRTPLDYASSTNHTNTADYLSKVKNITSDLSRKNVEEKLEKYKLNCISTGIILGKGAYSVVIELKLESDPSVLLAGKVFKASRSSGKMNYQDKLIKEFNIMVQMKHPNIVAYRGVYFQPDDILPMLVMERMMTSLHDYLLKSGNSGLPVERKVSFLLDTASGLEYLHSHTPAIIHRDLTAKNVLLDPQLRVKIADFSNSRIMELHSGSSHASMTTEPGTPDYMPPEAVEGSTHYDSSLDAFSFGHLSLFTVIQSPVHPLLPPNYTDPTGTLHPRSEVERREEFMKKAKELLSEYHPLLDLITRCLSNQITCRPSTTELVTRLQEMKTTAAFPVIRGADIVAQKTVEITPDQPLDFHWEGHGFKVRIPARAIRRDRGRVTLCIQASLSGDYQLPDDGVLVSGVYWLSLHPHVERFDKKVTISLQHCASDEDSSISFVTAKCTQETLPYTFKPLPGGSFDVSGEGTILVDHFSAKALFAKRKSNLKYAICSYYIPKQLNVTDIHITTTKNLDLQLKVVKSNYEGCEKGPNAMFNTKEEKISLKIPPDSEFPETGLEKDGWELTPLVPLTLEKSVLDNYKKEGIIPHFELNLQLKDVINPQSFQQIIYFTTGTKTFITLLRTPVPEPQASGHVREAQSMHPRLSGRGRDLGVAKGILVRYLQINGELRDLFRELGLANAILQEHYENYGLSQYAEYLLCAWINGRDNVLNNPAYPGGATWENLREALTKLGHHGAAEKI